MVIRTRLIILLFILNSLALWGPIPEIAPDGTRLPPWQVIGKPYQKTKYAGLPILRCIGVCECGNLLEDVKICFSQQQKCVDSCLEMTYLRATQIQIDY